MMLIPRTIISVIIIIYCPKFRLYVMKQLGPKITLLTLITHTHLCSQTFSLSNLRIHGHLY